MDNPKLPLNKPQREDFATSEAYEAALQKWKIATPPWRKPFEAPPEPIRPVRGGSWRKTPPLFRHPVFRYSFVYEMSSYPSEHRDRIALAEIEAIEREMSQLNGILHVAVAFIAGMAEHAIKKNLPADYVITNTMEFVKDAAIGQSIPDSDRQSILDAVRRLPQYTQAIRDVAQAKIDRSSAASKTIDVQPIAPTALATEAQLTAQETDALPAAAPQRPPLTKKQIKAGRLRQEKILPLLKEKKLSRHEWALAADVSPHVVYDYLSGRSVPHEPNRLVLAKLIDLETLPD